MGSLGPYAFPNTRKAFEASPLGTARGAQGFALAAAFVFGTPALVVEAGASLVGAGQLSASPRGVGLAGASLEGLGRLSASPQGVGLAGASLGGRGELVAGPQGVLSAGARLEGASALVASPDVATGAAAALVGASALGLETVTLRPTLLDKLGPKIGGLRATLALKIGDRPYRVYLTTVRWSGGEPGRGHRAPTRVELGCGVDRKTGLVQPPRIEATSPLKRPKYAAGRRGLTPASGETDVLYLTQLDPTYVERDLVPFVDLAAGEEAYYELEHVGGAGGAGGERPVRRYRLAEAPQKDALRMQWVLALVPVEPSKTFGGPRLG
ncbi:MAG TPA: hypothetical protein VFS43_38370 [Polyangiaceae bacterium]|nr:hypothetical protein [Polyangiaceae bacterium]